MGIHDGHRDRMRERFIRDGGGSFEKHELIEMLLYYVYPRIDTNEKAHKILNEFGGSITKLINSDPKTISDMCNVSKNVAVLLSLIGEIDKRIDIEKWDKNVSLTSTAYAGEYAKSYLRNLLTEKLYTVCLDNALSVIKCVEASSGNIDSAYLDMRTLIEIVVKSRATNIMLMHNHPSGICHPSYEDIKFTLNCSNALKIINVNLVDHIIVAGGAYFSMRDNNMMPEEGDKKYD